MSHKPSRTMAKTIKLKEKALRLLGNKCHFCEVPSHIKPLDAAHVLLTKLSRTGGSRGMYRRWKDISDNPMHYRMMCRPCHRKFDYLLDLREKQSQGQTISF